MKVIGIVALSILMFGCATQSMPERADPFNYNQNIANQNWTSKDYKRDHKLCQGEAQKKTVFQMDARAGEKVYRKCMEERGWRANH